MKIPGICSQRLSTIFSKPSNLKHSTELFDVKILPNETQDLNRFALITGKKKVSKSAVLRNRAERRMKAALQSQNDLIRIKGYDFLFFTKATLINAPWDTIKEQLSNSLKRIQKKADTKSPERKKVASKRAQKEKSHGKNAQTTNGQSNSI